MGQKFRTHRLFQLLSWIDALSRGYKAPGSCCQPAEKPVIDGVHRVPTAANLAYYLLCDGKYNRNTLQKRFSLWKVRETPHKDVFRYVKRDASRHLAQYPSHLFNSDTVRKTPETHPTFETGLESRRVEAKAYYLTARGRKRLSNLKDIMEFKQKLATTNTYVENRQGNVEFLNEETVLAETAVEQISDRANPEAIEIDSVTVPLENRTGWDVTTYTLPHIVVTDATRAYVPTVYQG